MHVMFTGQPKSSVNVKFFTREKGLMGHIKTSWGPLLACGSVWEQTMNGYQFFGCMIALMNGRELLSELKESLSRVGSDLKQKVIESVKSTWRTINDFALAHRTPAAPRTPTPEDAPEKDEDSIISDTAKDFDDSVCKLQLYAVLFF